MIVIDSRSVGTRSLDVVYSGSKAAETEVYCTLCMRD